MGKFFAAAQWELIRVGQVADTMAQTWQQMTLFMKDLQLEQTSQRVTRDTLLHANPHAAQSIST